VPYPETSAAHDEDGGTLTFFAVNRHRGETLDVEISLQGFGSATDF
jgi:alpha-N-arabinofuranosidase